jgi:NADH-quinone oxidoreductase subunit L
VKETLNPNLLLAIPLLPLVAAIVSGVFCSVLPRKLVHWLTIIGVAAACGLSIHVAGSIFLHGAETYNDTVYTWLVSDGIHHEGGVPGRSAHRADDGRGHVRLLVRARVHHRLHGRRRRLQPFLQLHLAVHLLDADARHEQQLHAAVLRLGSGGVVSYLLIGFWYKRPTAIFANMKAFPREPRGRLRFRAGHRRHRVLHRAVRWRVARLRRCFQGRTADRGQTFALPGTEGVNAMTFICIALFIGAMGKSAQVPLHVWLPDSMEGPTPISALIHAATMVTAGIFMVARMSPLFEFSEYALNFVLFIGATTALFMGFLGIINNDIKRVVAYSTLSQLGYMTVALGVSAYSFGIFHLMTHRLLQGVAVPRGRLVIIGMHPSRDMRKMGGLSNYCRSRP